MNSDDASCSEVSDGGRITSEGSSSSSATALPVERTKSSSAANAGRIRRFVARFDRRHHRRLELVQAPGLAVGEVELPLARDADDHCWALSPPGALSPEEIWAASGAGA